MVHCIDKHGLQLAEELANFVDEEALPGTDVSTEAFWSGFASLVKDMAPKNAAFRGRRGEFQNQIDDWRIYHRNQPHDHKGYNQFLKDIGYLVEEGPDFEIETTNVDPEIAKVPGPQLVVPITNARYALHAANARWGSLYDCLYGTDAMGSLPPKGGYDRGHGARVVARAHFLGRGLPAGRNKPRRCSPLLRPGRCASGR